MNPKHVLFFIPFSLSLGLFFSLACLRQKVVDKRYFKWVSLGSAGLAFLSWVGIGSFTLSLDTAYWVMGFCVFSTAFGLTLGSYKRVSTTSFFLALLSGLAALLLDVQTMFPNAFEDSLLINDLLSTLLLGFAMSSCLLSFVFRDKEPFPTEEMRRTTLLFIGVLTLRFLYGSYSLAERIRSANGLAFHTHTDVLVWIRWAIGLALPLLLTYWLAKKTKSRPDRSTLILFWVVTLLVLTGEALSDTLAFLRAIPF